MTRFLLPIAFVIFLLQACQSGDKLGKDKQTSTSTNTDSQQSVPPKPDTIKNVVKSKQEVAGTRKEAKATGMLMPEVEITSCSKAAEAIFLSSAKVQSLLKEKNVKYSLEYQPGDAANPNKRYWFWVFASSPKSSHSETYGRYQVDPKDGQLYENDLVADKAAPIASNPIYKKYLGQYCGK